MIDPKPDCALLELPALDMTPAPDAAPRVLVVDDSRFQRRILGSSLRKWGFQVVEADSGHAALDLCASAAPDIVLSDWMMPGMDGLEFCRQFREMPRETYGYFILLTSKSDKDEVAQGLLCGADDFLTKPVNPAELRARITDGERILRMERKQQQQNRIISETLAELTRLYDSLDRDLIQARNIQQSLLPAPETQLENARISVTLRPSGHVGGDLVGVFDAGQGQAGFYSIDVSGHGVTSAMMTARISGYLSSHFPEQNIALTATADGFHCRPPHEVAACLNRRLLIDVGVAEYFTMNYAAVDLATGHVRFVQAGHPQPILIPADGPARYIGQDGFPIGLLPDAEFETQEVTLSEGDCLLFYSDGFTEAALSDGSQLDEERFLAIVEAARGQAAQGFLDRIWQAFATAVTDTDQLEDDVSAILFEYALPAVPDAVQKMPVTRIVDQP